MPTPTQRRLLVLEPTYPGILETDSEAYWLASQKSGDYLVDLTGNGHDARFGSVGAARVINKGRAKYLRLPGLSGNYASTPDSAALDILGDITIDVKVSLNDWTPAASTTLVGKYDTVSSRAYGFNVATSGVLQLFTSPDGTSTVVNASTVAVPFIDGQTGWVRVSLDVDDGASNKVYKFYTSNDGVNWTQLGTTVTVAGTTSINNSPRILEIGSITGSANLLSGKVYNAKIYNSYLQDTTGTPVFNADFTNLADGTTSFTESSSNAATVTINSTSAADTNDPTYLEYTGTKYAYLPGVSGNYISAPDSAALDITGDIDLRAAINMDDWTPGASVSPLISKDDTTTRSYNFSVLSSGALRLLWSADGSASINHQSDALGQTDGTLLIVRVTMDVDDGAGNRVVKFFKKSTTEATANADMLVNTGWTQVGSTITTAATTSIFSSTTALALGMFTGGASTASIWSGKYYAASIHNGIDGNAVFNANFANATSPYATMTESSANAATVTFNRAATGKKLAIVDRTMLLLGTDDYLEVQDQAGLNFGASQDFTVAAVYKRYGATTFTIMSKQSALNLTVAGWSLYEFLTGPQPYFIVADGVAGAQDGGVIQSDGTLRIFAGVRSTGADTITAIVDSTTGSPTTDATTASVSNSDAMRIGRLAGGGGSNADMEFVGGAIFRKALTAAQLTQVKTELGG